MTQKNIGFIGTGLMGRGMARSLIRAGHKVTIFNRTRAKAEEAAQLGGSVAATPAEAVRGAEFIVTMLADPPAVREVIEGPNGVLSAIESDAILIDSSTVSPPTTLRTLEKLKSKRAHMLDAPVFGSKNEAENGKLGFIVGGEREVLQRAQEVLDCMGKTIYVGPNGQGAYAKLVVNLIVASTVQTFNEGMVLASKAGIDPDLMVQIIQSSRARSGMIEMKAPQILKRDFTPFFPLHLMNKDVGLIVETAQALNLSLPFATALKQIFSTSMNEGLMNEDFSVTIKTLEKAAGVEVKSVKPTP